MTLLENFTFTGMIFTHRYVNIFFPHLTMQFQNLVRGLVSLTLASTVLYFYNGITPYGVYLRISELDKKVIFLRTIGGSLTPFFLSGMGKYLRLSTSLTLTNLTPVIVMISAFYFLEEKLTKNDFITFGCSFAGVLIITKPFSKTTSNGKNDDQFVGFVYAAFALCSRAMATITQKLVGEHIEALVMVVYLVFVNVILTIFAFFIFPSSDPILENTNKIQSLNEFFWLSLIGVMKFLSPFCLMISIKYSEVVFLQPFNTISIVFSFFLSWVFFKDENHDVYDYIGAGIILTTNLFRSLHVYYTYKMGFSNKTDENQLDILKPLNRADISINKLTSADENFLNKFFKKSNKEIVQIELKDLN